MGLCWALRNARIRRARIPMRAEERSDELYPSDELLMPYGLPRTLCVLAMTGGGVAAAGVVALVSGLPRKCPMGKALPPRNDGGCCCGQRTIGGHT